MVFVMWVDVLLVLVAPVLSSCLVVPATYICTNGDDLFFKIKQPSVVLHVV